MKRSINDFKSILTTAIVVLFLTNSTFAQDETEQIGVNKYEQTEDDSATSKEINVPLQIAFVYPMSTDGFSAKDKTYKVSLNLLAGVTGGIDGFEASGFSNVTKGDLRGFQAAGFSNVVWGNAVGFQSSGFSNVAKGDFKGTQAAGFSNVTLGKVKGGQLAGFSNYSGGNFKGIQMAGFSNVAKDSVEGTQMAGFMNVTAGNVKGVQAAGFGNFASGYENGTQIAGFINVAADSVVNAQVSGFVNVAKDVEGTQIGFLNICDTITGVPVGFISIVRKGGYRTLELEANESLYANVSYKVGVPKLYNIFTVGARPTKDQLFWSFGYGLGSQLLNNGKMSLNLDATSSHINEGEWFTQRINMLNKLKLNVAYTTESGVTFYGGPSLNVFVRDITDRQGNNVPDPNLSTVNMYNWVRNNIETQLYPGLSLGARF